MLHELRGLQVQLQATQPAKKQGLLFHHWQDKGTGAGTMLNEEFNGDIADA